MRELLDRDTETAVPIRRDETYESSNSTVKPRSNSFLWLKGRMGSKKKNGIKATAKNKKNLSNETIKEASQGSLASSSNGRFDLPLERKLSSATSTTRSPKDSSGSIFRSLSLRRTASSNSKQNSEKSGITRTSTLMYRFRKARTPSSLAALANVDLGDFEIIQHDDKDDEAHALAQMDRQLRNSQTMKVSLLQIQDVSTDLSKMQEMYRNGKLCKHKEQDLLELLERHWSRQSSSGEEVKCPEEKEENESADGGASSVTKDL